MMRHSTSKRENSRIKEWKSYAHKDNLEFFADALKALDKEGVGNGGRMVIGLVGSRDMPGVTLRQAQSILRWDLRPSLWSEAFVIADRIKPGAKNLAAAPTLAASLHPRIADFPKPENNGVSEVPLGLYANPRLDANVALLAVNMSDEEADLVVKRAHDPNLDRVRFNLWETLGVWQCYLWSFGQRPNPLRESYPIASSFFIEYCFEGIQLDLSPGASERNSAPEHIWNGAKWWQQTLESVNRNITGYYVLRDKGCSFQSADEEL